MAGGRPSTAHVRAVARLPKAAPTPEQDINMMDGNGLIKGKRGRVKIDSR